MKRDVLLAVGGLFGLLIAVMLTAWVAAPSPAPAVDTDSRSAAAHAQQGATYLRQHFYQAAIREFETASRQSPGALDPWVGLAAAHIRLGDGRKALEPAGTAVSIASDSIEAWLILGRAHWLEGNLDEAENAGLKARELHSSSVPAAELLLHVYFDRRDDERFREVFDDIDNPTAVVRDLAVRLAVRNERFLEAYDLQTQFGRRAIEREVLTAQLALKRDSSQVGLYPRLVRNLVRLGRFEEALASADAYTGDMPLDLEIGKAHWLAGNREEAIVAYRRASAGITHKVSAEAALAALTGDRRHWVDAFRAERTERDYFVLARMEKALETGDSLFKSYVYRYAGLFENDFFNKAAEHALAAYDAAADPFEALMTLATAYFRLGRIDDAARYAQQGADRYPNRAEVWSRLGQLALPKSDFVTAERHLRRAVELEPSNPSYLYNYAWLLDQVDRDSEAVPYYERAIAASPLSFEAMNNLALIEAAAGRTGRAMDLLDRAVESNPENEAAYLNRANYHAVRRSWRSALADYRRALELSPGNAFAAVESARTHLELNAEDLAIEELNRALDANPNVHEAYIVMSSAYSRKGRDREAAAALEEAKRIEASQ